MEGYKNKIGPVLARYFEIFQKEFKGYKKGKMAMKNEEQSLELQAAYDKLKEEMQEWKEEAEELSKHCSECEEENAELNETITCLESESHNEISKTEYEDMIIYKEKEELEECQKAWLL